ITLGLGGGGGGGGCAAYDLISIFNTPSGVVLGIWEDRFLIYRVTHYVLLAILSFFWIPQDDLSQDVFFCIILYNLAATCLVGINCIHAVRFTYHVFGSL
ncbi:hypothetical protein ACJX0J_023582, partial [Zea mays]